jgi:hypothetical protein
VAQYTQRRIRAVLVNQEENPGAISGRVSGCIGGSVGVVDTDLWTWGGAYFGHRDGDELWTYDGRLVGRFVGDEVFGTDGRYLGEIREGDHLITDTHKKHKRRDSFFGQRRRVLEVQRMRGMRGMPGGYEDFPGPDKLVG